MGGGARITFKAGPHASFSLFPGLPHDVVQVGFLGASALPPPLSGHARMLAAHCLLPSTADLDEMCSPAAVKEPQPSESAGFLDCEASCL